MYNGLDKMNFSTFANKVIIRLIEQKKESPSGILLPENSQNGRIAKGRIVVIGTGKKEYRISGFENSEEMKHEIECKPDDIVLFRKDAFEEIEIEGSKYFVGSDEDVLVKINE